MLRPGYKRTHDTYSAESVVMHSMGVVRRLLPTLRLYQTRLASSSPRATGGDEQRGHRLPGGPGLSDFLRGAAADRPAADASTADRPAAAADEPTPYVSAADESGAGRRVLFEVHGCQMNVSDTEVAWSVLRAAGYRRADRLLDADVVLLVTCSIRDNAEQKIWNKLENYRRLKASHGYAGAQFKVGVLGCMAERLKQRLVEAEAGVDLVAGPDSYRQLPRLLAQPADHGAAVHVLLSHDETYADVRPVRLQPDAPTAFVTVMRGCDNMCTYCIVPFTRGRERSRPLATVRDEVRRLAAHGVKEVTLLGQNVNSYRDLSGAGGGGGDGEPTRLASGFSTVYRPRAGGTRFADLLAAVADVDPEMRVRFTSPHPKDFPDEVLRVVAERPNVCSSLHLPAQSGSSGVLANMRRGYTRDAYTQLVRHVRRTVPGVALTSDFIAGFCGETRADFDQTLSLLREVRFQYCYLFAYSRREKTRAHHRLADDVPADEKQRRVAQMADLYRQLVLEVNTAQVGQTQLVLLERPSKRSADFLLGRNDANVKVIVPRECDRVRMAAGQYAAVRVVGCSSEVLHARPLHPTTLQRFTEVYGSPQVAAAQSAGGGRSSDASQVVM